MDFSCKGGDVNSVVHIQSPHYRKSLSDQNSCVHVPKGLIISVNISRKSHEKSDSPVLIFISYFLWF